VGPARGDAPFASPFSSTALLFFSALLLSPAASRDSDVEVELSESESGVLSSSARNGTGEATPQPPSFEGALSNGGDGCCVHGAGEVDFGNRITNERAAPDR
jgi:hypothetical protein